MDQQSDTYQRIVDSAKELFYASSYADVGVAAICEKAQVKKGSFYHFFSSKQDLSLAVIDTYYSEYKDRILDQAFNKSFKPLDRFSRFIDMAVDMQANIHSQTGHVLGCPFGNMATEMSTQDEKIRIRLELLFKRFQGLIRATLQEAKDNGDIDIDDVEATASAILAYFEGCMMMAKTQNNPELLRELLPAALQIRL